MSDEQKMYEIKVSGQYVSSDKSKKMGTFEEAFQLPMCGLEALSEIQNRRIAGRLSEKFPDFKRVRLCKIISEKEAKTGAKPKISKLSDMTLGEVQDFVLAQKISVNVQSFASLDEAKREVQKALDDKALAAKLAKEKPKKPGTKKPTTKAGEEFGDKE